MINIDNNNINKSIKNTMIKNSVKSNYQIKAKIICDVVIPQLLWYFTLLCTNIPEVKGFQLIY